MQGRLRLIAVRLLDALSRLWRRKSHPDEMAHHLVVGKWGEEAVYFWLRQQGYVMVARNFRSPRHRGEIDLVGWDRDTLCFIEVKTRSRHSLISAEAAVDAPKQAILRATARTYLRRIRDNPPVRFDIVSIYCGNPDVTSDITLFKNAFPMS